MLSCFQFDISSLLLVSVTGLGKRGEVRKHEIYEGAFGGNLFVTYFYKIGVYAPLSPAGSTFELQGCLFSCRGLQLKNFDSRPNPELKS